MLEISEAKEMSSQGRVEVEEENRPTPLVVAETQSQESLVGALFPLM